MDDRITSGHRTMRWTVSAAAAAVLGTALLTAPAHPASAPSAAAPAGSRAGAAPLRTPAETGFAGGKWGDPAADKAAKDAYGRNQAEQDPGSLYTVEKAIGARALWGKKDGSQRQLTGQGVGVALLDSGVSAVPGLNAPGKVTYGPDLSIEENGDLAQQDTYGHGTFMAGIIAGRGASNPSADLPSAPGNVQLGVAPDAKLLAMKLATADGSTDVSQVIAALDWVTQHPVLPDGTRVRVINLSYGTDSTQSYRLDPLAAAAENAWRHGIVVVTSAGNAGTATGSLTDPAIDPYVLAVGATDSSDKIDGWTPGKAKVASFSNVGSDRHVDLVAPGTSIVSDRNPGSYVDANNPSGLVSGDTSKQLFRGSGTSQAAAVVSGAVALLLQAYPSLTPDQVKYALTSSADKLANATVQQAGAGTINLNKAMDAASHLVATDKNAIAMRAAAVQSFPQATGQGSLDAARGDAVLVDADGDPVVGEVDAQGNAWDPAAWWPATSNLRAWNGGSWLGTTWTGDGWDSGSGLSSARWTSARWTSARWTAADWSSARWTSARWTSARWTSARWTSARWTDADWLDFGW
jgi:serine protease AprX